MRGSGPAIPLLVCLTLLALATAGCVQNGDDAPPYEATYQSNRNFSMSVDQVTLHDEIEPATEKTWTLRAANNGEPGGNTFEYETGCGDKPWIIELTGPAGPTAWREPPVTCQGFETREFHGGETIDFGWTWNARTWTGSGYTDAEPGIYTLRVTFEAMHAGTHPSDANGVTTFRVNA